MSEYYVLSGKERKGPYTLKQLKENNPTPETLVWTEGMDGWTKVRNTAELSNHLIESQPPPIPKKVLARELIVRNRGVFIFLLVWSVIHLCLLSMSYGNTMDANVGGSYQAEKVWPFVEFEHEFTTRESYVVNPTDKNPWLTEEDVLETRYYDQERQMYGGFLYNYDWSEFVLYVMPFWMLSVFYYFIKRGA